MHEAKFQERPGGASPVRAPRGEPAWLARTSHTFHLPCRPLTASGVGFGRISWVALLASTCSHRGGAGSILQRAAETSALR